MAIYKYLSNTYSNLGNGQHVAPFILFTKSPETNLSGNSLSFSFHFSTHLHLSYFPF